MSLLVLCTGGTIEKEYLPIPGVLAFGKPKIEVMLQQAQLNHPPTIEHLFAKDSLEMDDHDRMRILERIRVATEDRILITHGTDTMPETARFLSRNLSGKTIVLTGAMVPASVNDSDAHFNLGFACCAALHQKPGVWVAMGGEIFEANRVAKNKKEGRFYAKAN